MDQAVNARDDVSERAKGCETNDLCLDNSSLGILVLEDLPRIVLCVLCLLVDILDVNLNSVADIDNLAGVLDVGP